MLEKVLLMVPMAFGTLGKAATPKETPTKETPRKSKQTPSKKGLNLNHSQSHRRGRHLQSVQPLYVVYYPICFSISEVHLGICPVVLAPYLHSRVPRLLLYSHRAVYVMLLLGQQRHVQV